MAITGSFTDTAGAQSTASVVPGTQFVIFDGDFTGFVWVEVSKNGSAPWTEVPNSRRSEPSSYPMICPDPSIQYRFNCARITGTVNYRMGP